jgi:DNA repair exonuclease SbcCD nuclease subunit
MAFRFIHTADWHIGKAFGVFEDDIAVPLRRARIETVDRIATAADRFAATHILVAGDVYDSQGLSDRDLRQLMERLRRHGGLVWHLLPGNHDPSREGGVWARLGALGVPDNVRLHLDATEVAIADDVSLLTAPCTSYRMSEDPTAWMDDAPGSEGRTRIGLAHGPAHGFGGENSPSGMISPGRRVSAGLDYLALGDWHGVKELAAGVWYAGTPEPDQFPDNQPGYVLGVSIAHAGAPAVVEPIETAQYRWFRRTYRCADHDDVRVIEEDLRGLDADLGRCLVRIEVAGEVSIAVEEALRRVLDDVSAALFHIRERLDGLTVRLGGDDADTGIDPTLQPVLVRLVQRAEEKAESAPAARAAMRLLARFGRDAARGS